jgi:hypothetical protein
LGASTVWLMCRSTATLHSTYACWRVKILRLDPMVGVYRHTGHREVRPRGHLQRSCGEALEAQVPHPT